jgi:hypothetical protein
VLEFSSFVLRALDFALVVTPFFRPGSGDVGAELMGDAEEVDVLGRAGRVRTVMMSNGQ